MSEHVCAKCGMFDNEGSIWVCRYEGIKVEKPLEINKCEFFIDVDFHIDNLNERIQKLEAENKELWEVVEFYARIDDDGKLAEKIQKKYKREREE